jgi:hypothetical protein
LILDSRNAVDFLSPPLPSCVVRLPIFALIWALNRSSPRAQDFLVASRIASMPALSPFPETGRGKQSAVQIGNSKVGNRVRGVLVVCWFFPGHYSGSLTRDIPTGGTPCWPAPDSTRCGGIPSVDSYLHPSVWIYTGPPTRFCCGYRVFRVRVKKSTEHRVFWGITDGNYYSDPKLL